MTSMHALYTATLFVYMVFKLGQHMIWGGGWLHHESGYITDVYIHQFTLRSEQVAFIGWVAATYM